MVRFMIGLLLVLAIVGGVLGWLWYVAESLETPPRQVEKVVPYDPPRR